MVTITARRRTGELLCVMHRGRVGRGKVEPIQVAEGESQGGAGAALPGSDGRDTQLAAAGDNFCDTPGALF
jgi:hypothetical protein